MNDIEKYFRKRDQRTQDNAYLKVESRLDNGQYACKRIGSGAAVIASKANPNDEFVPGTVVIATYLGASKATLGGQWVIISRAPQEQKGTSANPSSTSEEEFSNPTVSTVEAITIEQGGVSKHLYIFGTGFMTAPVLPTGLSYDGAPVISLTSMDLKIKAAADAPLGFDDIVIATDVVATKAVEVVVPAVLLQDPNILWMDLHDYGSANPKQYPRIHETVNWTQVGVGGDIVFDSSLQYNCCSGIVEEGTNIYISVGHGTSTTDSGSSIKRIASVGLGDLAMSANLVKAGGSSFGTGTFGNIVYAQGALWLVGLNGTETQVIAVQMLPVFGNGASWNAVYSIVSGITGDYRPQSVILDPDAKTLWVGSRYQGIGKFDTLATAGAWHTFSDGGQISGAICQDDTYIYAAVDTVGGVRRIKKSDFSQTDSGILFGAVVSNCFPYCITILGDFLYVVCSYYNGTENRIMIAKVDKTTLTVSASLDIAPDNGNFQVLDFVQGNPNARNAIITGWGGFYVVDRNCVAATLKTLGATFPPAPPNGVFSYVTPVYI